MRGPLVWGLLGGASVSRAGWIDTDSPEEALTTQSLVNASWDDFVLVFSDEFDVPRRKFADGDDPRWTAIDKNDYTNKALHYYDKDYVSTVNGGYLNISTAAKDTIFTSLQIDNRTKKVKKKRLKKHFKSGMLQSWNKFCFTGGILEIRAKLPGRHDIGGLWPAMWLLGNLARSTYVASSDYVWPWSYDRCSRGDQRKQAVSACEPSPHFALNARQGRGAPEIDLLEAMPGQGVLPWGMTKPYFSTSFQVAPGKQDPRPYEGDVPHPGQWYEGMEYGENSSINVFFYGVKLEHAGGTSYQADAISANTPIGRDHFENFHVYRVEWQPPASTTSSSSSSSSSSRTASRRRTDDDAASDDDSSSSVGGREENDLGYLRWFLDGEFVYGLEGRTLRDVTGSHVPDEPVYLLLNTAVSSTWGFPVPCPRGCSCDCYDCSKRECRCATYDGFCDASLPAEFLIDYVRVFQKSTDATHTVGCSTRTHPTRKYIEGHKSRYSDPDVPGRTDPLLPVIDGGGACDADDDCGPDPRSTCRGRKKRTRKRTHASSTRQRKRTCACSKDTTGPHCRAGLAFDDVDLDPDADADFGLRVFYAPPSLLRLGLAVAILTVALTCGIAHKESHRKNYGARLAYSYYRHRHPRGGRGGGGGGDRR